MGKNWTLSELPRLEDKTVIVTGGNSGLGLEAVRAFAGNGASVILCARDTQRGLAVEKDLKSTYPLARIEVMELDLADLESIRRFADTFANRYPSLDILLNNAGIMMTPWTLTRDGFESQMGTNHLGHFALTARLLGRLKSTPYSRVITISSNIHRMGKMDFSNLLFENGHQYNPIRAYGRSKLANLLFTYELQRRFHHHGWNSIALAAHPGFSRTDLGRHISRTLPGRALMAMANLFSQKAELGALPGIRAAVDPAVKGGEYFGPDGPRQMRGYPVKQKSGDQSYNRKDARHLWDMSEELTGIAFEF